ncbi:MAG: hypothetical protein ACT4OP_11365, partial [Actinomycetota bacterium]
MRRLSDLMGVRSEEGPLVAWIFALFAVTQAGQGLAANTADTLFFVRFGVESLPVMILISGPVLMVTTLVYAGGLGRLGSRRWLAPTLAAMAGLLVIERVAVSFDVPAVYAVVWLGAQAAILVSYTVMWNAASDCCDTRQAKRLFPLFAAAGIFGGV